MRVSYRVSLIVAIPLLVLTTGGIIATRTFLASRDTVRGLADDLFREVAQKTVDRTQSHLARAVPAIDLLALLAREGTLAAPGRDPDQVGRQLLPVLQANPGFSWVTYSERDGAFAGVYRTTDGKVRLNASRVVDGKTARDDSELGPDGKWRRVGHAEDTRYDPRLRPFWKLAESAKRRIWTEPYVFFDEAVPGITCATPVLDGDGRQRGVLTVDFNLNTLSEFVAALKLSSRGRVFLFTPDGKLVAHPTVRAVEKKGGGTAGELTTVAKSGDPVAEALLAALGGAVSSTRELTVGVGGERWMARVQPFSIDDNAAAARWLVAAVAPESDFLGGVRKTTLTAIAISVVALGGALILAILLANRVSRPLLRLADEMNRVGSFELDLEPQPPTVFVEIAKMGEALDKMKRGLHSFASYVPRDLVRTLVASGREAKLGGETATLTVFFSDLAGFTTLSETMQPDQLVAQLGGYLDEMTRTIERGGGTVDKFIGDGIMAFWGAPLPDGQHAARALVAALRCQERLEVMRSRPDGQWMRGVETRIGLATGDVVVGNIGTPERMNYTVMGDTVNLAARLESLSKLYGTLLLAEERAVVTAGDAVVSRPVDVVAVKGKKRGVRVFELLAVKGEASEATLALASSSAAGLEAYLARDFASAERHYRKALEVAPGDRVAQLFVERAQALAAAPPPAEWDGTYVAKEK